MTNNPQSTMIPILPIKEVVVFPQMVAPLLINREYGLKALELVVSKNDNNIVLVAQMNPGVEDVEISNLHQYGVLCRILQLVKFPDGSVKAIIEGINRVKVEKFEEDESIILAQIVSVPEETSLDHKSKALFRLAFDKFEQFIKKNHSMSPENFLVLSGIGNEPGKLADIMATYLEMELEERQKILEISDATERLEIMSKILERELQMLDIEEAINNKLRLKLNKHQREFYLKEKIKVINDELKQEGDSDDLTEYKTKVQELNICDKSKQKLLKEVNRLDRMPPYSTEVAVIRTYLDRVLELPWNNQTEDIKDINYAKKVLDEDHWGLEDVKERIIEFLAVKQLTNKKNSTILCLVGPPGVGKTSLAKSVARSMNRQFSYISLGGINDESEIRGHRRTYIGSMPGRIIQAVENAGTNNPVILLDEIEKMMRSHMGDPTAAMLEVLDPEQNKNFTDHYIDMPFDLSEVFFIATANTLDNIYKALRDRLEIIKISGYTEEEKVNIAKHFLVPKQIELHGLKKSQLKIGDKITRKIINEYTKEAGVRGLERSIAKICRKVATLIVKNEESKVSITPKNLDKFLGSPKFVEEEIQKIKEVGVIKGLAWTEYGGNLLQIESTKMPGKGKLYLTGSLGDIMQESAKTAFGYIRSNHKKFNLIDNLQEKYDIHIHVPDGATPKDGPSAGLAIALTIISTLTERPIKADFAITGEITLHGKVLPIGGLKEKVLAALRNNIYTVIIPDKNKKDVNDLPDYIKDKMKFIYVNSINQVLDYVF